MTITETKNGDTCEMIVSGRLDTTTAPMLEAKLKDVTRACRTLILNFSTVEYISSAGLRVVLLAHKLMQGINGKMSVKSPSDFCLQVFEATGMDGVLSII